MANAVKITVRPLPSRARQAWDLFVWRLCDFIWERLLSRKVQGNFAWLAWGEGLRKGDDPCKITAEQVAMRLHGYEA